MSCQHWYECGVTHGGCCGIGLRGGRPSYANCLLCARNSDPAWYRERLTQLQLAPPAVCCRPLAPSPFPLWAKWVRRRRIPADRGVGDTVKRLWIVEAVGSTMRAAGVPCRCAERQQEWNELYPYRSPAGEPQS